LFYKTQNAQNHSSKHLMVKAHHNWLFKATYLMVKNVYN